MESLLVSISSAAEIGSEVEIRWSSFDVRAIISDHGKIPRLPIRLLDELVQSLSTAQWAASAGSDVVSDENPVLPVKHSAEQSSDEDSVQKHTSRHL